MEATSTAAAARVEEAREPRRAPRRTEGRAASGARGVEHEATAEDDIARARTEAAKRVTTSGGKATA